MDILFSVSLVLILGFIGGRLFNKIKLPSLIGMLIIGILIGPNVLGLISENMFIPLFNGSSISSILRQIALIIIITRAGLSLNINDIKKLGKSGIFMCFVPACFEIIGVSIFGPLIFDITFFEALLLGSVLAAVSPAVIVPRMIKLKEEGYKNVSSLVLAGASLDDVIVIVLFYSFLGLVSNNNFNYNVIYKLPLSIICGILIGILVGLCLKYLFSKLENKCNFKLLITFSVSLFLVSLENYIEISFLLSVMTIGIFLNKDLITLKELKNSYNGLWSFFEILLFVLVGCELSINYAFSNVLSSLLLFLISLSFRSFGVLLSLIGSNFNNKERIFIILSYLPKATVQASIGGIALSNGLACGELILTVAVLSILVTAPIGAILIDNLYDKLLVVDVIEN